MISAWGALRASIAMPQSEDEQSAWIAMDDAIEEASLLADLNLPREDPTETEEQRRERTSRTREERRRRKMELARAMDEG